ncbi:MAG: single-stranded-DNA-specific exonuclease RecJ [Bacillota bacterium]
MGRMTEKTWTFLSPRADLLKIFVSKLGLSPLVAQVLINRGISSVEEAHSFLLGKQGALTDPLIIPGMHDCCSRLALARQNKERVLVFGDYDADGVTATALLYEYLCTLGFDAGYYIPNRLDEGYGINNQALEKARDQGFNLVITVDCGINSVQETDYARNIGLDMIITDHHEPPEILPLASAVVNPKLAKGQNCGLLAGVGVAYAVVRALGQYLGSVDDLDSQEQQFLDLVTVGTIADLVPLQGDNRILVARGLKYLSETKRPGLRALLELTSLWGQLLTSSQVGFVIGPRINATGRLSSADKGVELLLTTSPQRAWELAQGLNRENEQRQMVEGQILVSVEEMIKEQIVLERDWVIVLASPFWHQGVIGIVASRVAEKYHRPTVLIALEGDIGKGSARSISGFDLYHSLEECRDLLIRFGGHRQAAGLSIEAGKIQQLREMLNHLAHAWLTEQQLFPSLTVDAEVFFTQLDWDTVNQLEQLEPHGFGNAAPVFTYRKALVTRWKAVGQKNEHLKLTLQGEEQEFDAIGFGMAAAEIASGEEVDLAFYVERNKWNGRESIQLKLRDIRKHCSTNRVQVNDTLVGDLSPLQREAILSLEKGMHTLTGLIGWNGELGVILPVAIDMGRHRLAITVIVLPFLFQNGCVDYFRGLMDAVGLKAAWGNSDLDNVQVSDLVRTLEEGAIDILLVTPELLQAMIGSGGNWRSRVGLLAFSSSQFAQDGPETLQELWQALSSPLVFGTGIRPSNRSDWEWLQPGNYIDEQFPEPCWIDHRGEDQNGSLARVMDTSGTTMIIVRGPREAHALLKNIRSGFPALSNKVALYHQDLVLEQRMEVEKLVEGDMLAVVIATWNGEGIFRKHFQQVIIHHLPLDPTRLFLLTGSNERVLCFWTGEELEKDRQKIMDLYPDRTVIGALFHKMVAYGAGNKPVPVNQIEKNLKQNEKDSLKTSLAIMEELGLVTIDRNDGEYTVKLLPVSGGKKDLHCSWRYREGERARQSWNVLYQWATGRTILPPMDILYSET